MSSVKKSREDGKRIRLVAGEEIVVGVDVHKRSYHVSVWSVQRDRVVTSWVQPADRVKLCGWLSGCRERTRKVVYEAGPTGFGLARYLLSSGVAVEVVSAAQTPRARGRQEKSDRLDATALARFGAKGLLSPVAIPTEQEEADRQVFRTREQFADRQRQVKTQIKSFLLMHGIEEPAGLGHWSNRSVEALRALRLGAELGDCLEVLLDELAHVRTQLARMTRRIRKLLSEERHREKGKVLQSTPGVGLITSAAMMLELFRPERFETAGQVAKMLGLAPLVRGSGERRLEQGRICCGNRRARSLLVEAAWRWKRSDARASALFDRLMASTGNGKKAVVGLARKLGIILWRMMTRMEPYRAAA